MNARYRRIFTEDELSEAKRLRARGVAWIRLKEIFHCDTDTIKRAITPGYAEKRALGIREAAYKRGGWKSRTQNPMFASRHTPPPDDVLIERDLALTAPVTLTQILCGDPPPGRSALDKKSQQPSNLAEPYRIIAGFKVGLSHP